MVFSEPENGKSSGGNLEEDTVFHQTAKSKEMNQVTTETVSSFMEATTLHGARFFFQWRLFQEIDLVSSSRILFRLLYLSDL